MLYPVIPTQLHSILFLMYSNNILIYYELINYYFKMNVKGE